MSRAESPKRVKITLQYPHEHGGESHPAGAQIEVWDFQAARIREHEQQRKQRENTHRGAE